MLHAACHVVFMLHSVDACAPSITRLGNDCTVLQRGVLCCSVLDCVAAWCTVLQRGVLCCSVLHCVAAWCTVLLGCSGVGAGDRDNDSNLGSDDDDEDLADDGNEAESANEDIVLAQYDKAWLHRMRTAGARSAHAIRSSVRRIGLLSRRCVGMPVTAV